MGNLEKTLAEIEVLVGELDKRAQISAEPINSQYVSFCNFYTALAGIRNDSKLVYKKHSEAIKAIKAKRVSDGSTYLGEMAMDCKNLADNLNIFLQATYGTYTGKLNSLKENTQDAPRTEEGFTFSEILSRTHDYSKTSLVKNCRDSKGHVRGHSLLSSSSNCSSGFCVHYGEPGNHHYGPDAIEFIDSQAQAYLEMTKTILQTIANKDENHFGKRKGSRKFQVQKQRARNFYQRHAGLARTIAGTALLVGGLVGGSLGTLAYQQHQREKEMRDSLDKRDLVLDVEERFKSNFEMWELGYSETIKEELVQKRKGELQRMLVEHPEFAQSYNLKNIFGTESNLFTQTIGEIEQKQRNLGVYIDNYLAMGGRIQSYWPNPQNKAEGFITRRAEFRSRLQKLIETTKGKAPNFEQLQELEKLRSEVTNLEDTETDLLPYIKPLSINLTNMNPRAR